MSSHPMLTLQDKTIKYDFQFLDYKIGIFSSNDILIELIFVLDEKKLVISLYKQGQLPSYHSGMVPVRFFNKLIHGVRTIIGRLCKCEDQQRKLHKLSVYYVFW